MSELLAAKREVFGLTSGRFLTTGSSLPLAELSTAGSLVAAGPLNSALTGASSPLLKYFL
jgi:hypothetical protein